MNGIRLEEEEKIISFNSLKQGRGQKTFYKI